MILYAVFRRGSAFDVHGSRAELERCTYFTLCSRPLYQRGVRLVRRREGT